MVGAAVRKPRVPNDKLHRVTDNKLAEADRKVLHGCAGGAGWQGMEDYRY